MAVADLARMAGCRIGRRVHAGARPRDSSGAVNLGQGYGRTGKNRDIYELI